MHLLSFFLLLAFEIDSIQARGEIYTSTEMTEGGPTGDECQEEKTYEEEVREARCIYRRQQGCLTFSMLLLPRMKYTVEAEMNYTTYHLSDKKEERKGDLYLLSLVIRQN